MQAVNNRLHASAINVGSLPKDVAATLTTGCHIHQQAVATVQLEKFHREQTPSRNQESAKTSSHQVQEYGDYSLSPTPNVSRTLRMSRPAQRRLFLTDKFLLLTKARENSVV